MLPMINKRETGINLRRIMDQRGMTAKDIQKYLGLGSVQSIYHWLNGMSMPTIDNLYALSHLFQLSIDDLVRGNRPAMVSYELPGTVERQSQRLYMYYKKFCEIYAA